MPYANNDDTIAASATASGENSISIIRLSGPKAIAIANEIFSGDVLSYQSHTVHLGRALTRDGKTIDQCLLIVMKAPRSYTGEHVVEIHCHGGFFAPAQILEGLFLAGARPALPGEFTFRAFMNGKMDLMQAEAVQKIISAQNGEAFAIAQDELSGKLSEKIRKIKDSLVLALALIEAFLDFPEDVEPNQLKEKLTLLIHQSTVSVGELVDNFDEGRRILSGTEIALVGEPNVGKSSLLNVLTETNASIVSSISGTTRDFVKEELRIHGKLIKLIDTAGIRETDHPLEQEGVNRTKQLISRSSLILWVIDPASPPTTLIPGLSTENAILVQNKIDLTDPIDPKIWKGQTVNISTKTGEGIQELKRVLYERIRSGKNTKENIFLITQRQFNSLQNIRLILSQVEEDLQHMKHPECLAADLRTAIEETGFLSGFSLNESILDEIFGTFCIGK